MTEGTPKKLNDSFSAAAGTDKLLKEVNDQIKILKDGLAKTSSPLIELPMVSDVRVLEICLGIIRNQQRQDLEIAALKKRLEDLEGGGPTLKLDKGPNPPSP